MPKRTAAGQTRHDRAVRSHADALKRQGWSVKADVKGFDRPPAVRNGGSARRRPDIVATRDGKTKMVEWETRQSLGKDRSQHDVFRGYARRRPNTSVDVRIC